MPIFHLWYLHFFQCYSSYSDLKPTKNSVSRKYIWSFFFSPLKRFGTDLAVVSSRDAEPVYISGTTYTYEIKTPVAEADLSFTFEMTDKAILQQAYDYATTYVEDGTVDQLDESVRAAFMEAYQGAKDVLDNAKASQDDINEAWSELLDMIHYLG